MRILAKESVDKIGEKVELAGWVDTRRDHGKLIFIDLRDRSGILQLVFTPKNEQAYKIAEDLRSEWVIKVIGEVRARPDNMVNKDAETGKVEISVDEVIVLNESKNSPFPLNTDGKDIDEDLRYRYRYLDLRRERLNKNIKLRSKLLDKIRQYFFSKDFIEIETPLLTKSTPEGSRDFVVPSRMYPGKFFALPQSPQQYKQLLMVAGFERYFQIAKCVRDEDLRADRGFEHTQVDMEMSFVSEEDILSEFEAMMIQVTEFFGYELKDKPFPRFTYQEAMEKFGADKFDLRSDKEKEKNVLAFAWVTDFPFFEKDKEGKWTFTHNPFSQPKEEDLEKLISGKDIGKITATQYDLVCNGHEISGGSLRAYKPEVLKAVFKILGYGEEEIKEKFGHMIEAFEYGAPPHGGIGMGFERLMGILTKEDHLRETQAFPQTGTGRTSAMEAPTEITDKQLKELGIKVDSKKKNK